MLDYGTMLLDCVDFLTPFHQCAFSSSYSSFSTHYSPPITIFLFCVWWSSLAIRSLDPILITTIISAHFTPSFTTHHLPPIALFCFCDQDSNWRLTHFSHFSLDLHLLLRNFTPLLENCLFFYKKTFLDSYDLDTRDYKCAKRKRCFQIILPPITLYT